jgi:hypothetical protein
MFRSAFVNSAGESRCDRDIERWTSSGHLYRIKVLDRASCEWKRASRIPSEFLLATSEDPGQEKFTRETHSLENGYRRRSPRGSEQPPGILCISPIGAKESLLKPGGGGTVS